MQAETALGAAGGWAAGRGWGWMRRQMRESDGGRHGSTQGDS